MAEDKEKHEEEDYHVMLEGKDEEKEKELSLIDFIEKKGIDSNLGSTRSGGLSLNNCNTGEELLYDNEEKTKKSIIITTKEVPKELQKESKISEVIDNPLLIQQKNLDTTKKVNNTGEIFENNHNNHNNHNNIDDDIQSMIQEQAITEKLFEVYDQNEKSLLSLEEFDDIVKDKNYIGINNEIPESKIVRENNSENSEDVMNISNIETNINYPSIPHFIEDQNHSVSNRVSNGESSSQIEGRNIFEEVYFKNTQTFTRNYNG